MFTGCNVESISYGHTICAERTAIVKGVSEGHRKFIALAVAAESKDFTSPCGGCRQLLVEFAWPLPIFLCKPDGSVMKTSLEELLPEPFSPMFVTLPSQAKDSA
ncbi:unnamed protein product [Darwinula stevensoni]|uniref:CMP/dCMP-type deaminase domain-containing protein n=1 Tax=Darwinula stevensoni TaxID=69355 RepID=A0A7R9A2N3_9CRUS|nr:unnamed protein product [Darwinula stevensoni]CAG0890051.1 unnamed protein product [Darwinula stevensoni]